jgi:hypothetical protein
LQTAPAAPELPSIATAKAKSRGIPMTILIPLLDGLLRTKPEHSACAFLEPGQCLFMSFTKPNLDRPIRVTASAAQRAIHLATSATRWMASQALAMTWMGESRPGQAGEPGQALPVPRNPALARFLARLTPELAQSFSPAQLAAIELHFGMRHRAAHAIDWRRRLNLPFARVYVVLLAGKEERG